MSRDLRKKQLHELFVCFNYDNIYNDSLFILSFLPFLFANTKLVHVTQTP